MAWSWLRTWRTVRAEYPRVPENDVRLPPNGRRVVVIGAGLSGLVAALELLDRGFAVTVLERSTAVGGRLLSWRDPSFGGGARGIAIERATHGVWWTYNNLREHLGRLGIALRGRWVNEPHGSVPVVGGDGVVRRYRIGRHLPSLLHGVPFWWSARRQLAARGQSLRPAHLLALMAYDPSDRAQTAYLDGLSMDAWGRAWGLPDGLLDDFASPLLEMCNFRSGGASSALAWHRFAATHFAHWRDIRATQFFDGPPHESLFPALVERLRARGGELHLGAEVERILVGDGHARGVVVAAVPEGTSRCPSCHAPGVRPCRACGCSADGFARAPRPPRTIEADAVLAGLAIPAARDLLARSGLADHPGLRGVAALPVARPVVVWLRYPATGAWAAAHGQQEILFTSRFPTIGTLIHRTLLHPEAQEPGCEVIEADLAEGERFAEVSDAEVAARVHADLAVAVPGLPPPEDHRVLRGADFSSVEVGSEAHRPDVACGVPGLYLLGDWVRVPQNCFGMEHCVVSARVAVNDLVARAGTAGAMVVLPSETPSPPLAWVRRLASVRPPAGP